MLARLGRRKCPSTEITNAVAIIGSGDDVARGVPILGDMMCSYYALIRKQPEGLDLCVRIILKCFLEVGGVVWIEFIWVRIFSEAYEHNVPQNFLSR